MKKQGMKLPIVPKGQKWSLDLNFIVAQGKWSKHPTFIPAFYYLK